MQNNQIRKQVLSGLLWKFGERITAQLISLIVSIILARLLLPSDYGAVALVMVFITLANVFVSNGFGSALIQKKDADNLDFSSVFYINIAVSILLYALIFAVAPVIASFYDLPVLKAALRILGIRIVIAAVNSVQQAYVSRQMLFKRFFWSTLFGTALSGIVGISMAYGGFGVWALVAQYLTNTCTDTIVLWFTVRWRPDLKCSWKRAKGLLTYGWKILVSALVDTGYKQLRSLVIGKVYTSEDLAYYNQGDKYPSLIVTNVNASISSVIFPAMSQYQNDPIYVKQMTRRAVQVSSFIMWPLMIGFAVCAEPIVRIVLTEKWLPCVPYIRIFCFTYGLWPIHTANLQALNAMGRSDQFLKLEIIKKTVGLAALLLTIRISPLAIAWSLIITDIISVFINAYPNIKLLDYKYSEQLKDLLPPFVIAGGMAAIIYPFQLFAWGDWLTLAVQVFVGAILYLLFSVFTKQPALQYLFSFIRKSK